MKQFLHSFNTLTVHVCLNVYFVLISEQLCRAFVCSLLGPGTKLFILCVKLVFEIRNIHVQ